MSTSQIAIGGALLTWLTVISAGMTYLAYYDQRAGEQQTSPAFIAPLASPATDKQRLLMFVHPRCPCSTASLRELERLMARCHDQIDATVYFICPAGESDAWVHGRLWDLAQSIQDTTRQVDAGGQLSKQFGATTSGTIVLYDPAGHLKYQGGITVARGHEGDSRGKDALFALARGETQAAAQCPVYGCPLTNSAAASSPADNPPAQSSAHPPAAANHGHRHTD
jgi:hypothetical protein